MYIGLVNHDDLCCELSESRHHIQMYLRNLLCTLLPVLALMTIITAGPVSQLGWSIANTKVRAYAGLPIASPSHLIKRRTAFTKRTVPWTTLGNGWLGATVDFSPILPSQFAFTALRQLYWGVAERCLAGMLQGSRTPTNSLVLRIGALQFLAEATDTMDWDVIYHFVLKMREMVELGATPLYTMMFTNVAGHALMFSIRVAGMDGRPIE